jgi:CARDB
MNLIFQYAVKVVLGKSEGEVTAPGEYWTAINVHNPTYMTVQFRKKIAIGLPGEQPGPVSRFFEARLGADEALEIDRRDIFQHVGSDRFLKGFVVIESPMELDVVAVYTAAGREGFVETLHTERVMPRRIEMGMPDLVPVPDAQGSFCKREDGTLIVTVRNQGSTGAGPSTTRVDFGAHGASDLPTPALAAGAAVDLRFPIPPGCFDPDCEFRIVVDVTNVVVESDEGNNFASGVCLG